MRAALALWLTVSGCSFVLDAGSLTDGARPSGSAGASGSSAEDCGATCDGLDARCQPTTEEPECPSGCDGRRLNGQSYLGCTTSASFEAAEVRCGEQGMRLLRIESAGENAVAVELARSLGSYVWIGGSDLGTPGTFAWPDSSVFFGDGQPVSGVYQNFGEGEPSPAAGRHCVQLHNDAAGPWSTAPCTDVKEFICKRY
jgi:hypothetical protein